MSDRLDTRLERIEEAMIEAERFLQAGHRARAEIQSKDCDFGPTVHFSAAKRSSMDLTRALAQLRKSPYSE